jgi:hypothetical protein
MFSFCQASFHWFITWTSMRWQLRWAIVNLWTASVSWSLSHITCSSCCWAAFLAAVTSANSALNLSASVGSGRGSHGAS